MKLSTDRTLTTHTGSLPRSQTLSDLLIAQEKGTAVDDAALAHEAHTGVELVVGKQIDSGIDVISNGEQPRVGFQTYAPQRLDGFGGVSERRAFLDFVKFPDYGALFSARVPAPSKVFDAPAAIADVRYRGGAEAEAECDMFLELTNDSAAADRFMTAASPGIICTTLLNQHYPSHNDYVMAVAREMKHEYDIIHNKGLVLQLDCPDLAMESQGMFQDESPRGFAKAIEPHIEAINVATENIPAADIRLHVCYGNYDGPHYHDVPLEYILPVIYQAKVGALSLELANPRHQHEYDTLRQLPLPKDMALIPGVVESTSNYVEHPQVICNRILEAVDAVGDRERVIAGSDCGFGTFAGWEFVATSIVWAKFESLRDGAALASQKLWGG